jgi:hypothetical protein
VPPKAGESAEAIARVLRLDRSAVHGFLARCRLGASRACLAADEKREAGAAI